MQDDLIDTLGGTPLLQTLCSDLEHTQQLAPQHALSSLFTVLAGTITLCHRSN